LNRSVIEFEKSLYLQNERRSRIAAGRVGGEETAGMRRGKTRSGSGGRVGGGKNEFSREEPAEILLRRKVR
jgi:hypothetical protein